MTTYELTVTDGKRDWLVLQDAGSAPTAKAMVLREYLKRGKIIQVNACRNVGAPPKVKKATPHLDSYMARAQ